MLADLLARTLLNPRELPIGVVTSFVGAFTFVFIFYRTRRRNNMLDVKNLTVQYGSLKIVDD
jgi:hypothetical protein